MDKLIEDKYEAHKAEVNARFEQLRANEEELNRIFARIYNMEGEVPIEVEDKYVSVARIFDTAEEIPESYKGNRYVRTRRDEIVSLISYAVGCMLGRCSLDVDGLVLADAGATVDDYLAKMSDPEYVTFMPDSDNVLPITDDEYFGDDIVARLVEFVSVAYGAQTLEENLRFIADALGGKGAPREVIRSYRPCSTRRRAPTCARGCWTTRAATRASIPLWRRFRSSSMWALWATASMGRPACASRRESDAIRVALWLSSPICRSRTSAGLPSSVVARSCSSRSAGEGTPISTRTSKGFCASRARTRSCRTSRRPASG